MTLSLALVQVGLRIGRWLLPWVVFVSATLAFAVNVSTGEGTGPAAVERSTTSPSAQSADRGPIVTPEGCAPLGSGYMDSSIVAESRKIDCGWAP
jgi:hypothetical protein